METATALFITDLEIGTSEHDDGLGWREAEAWRVARAIAEHVKEHAERIAVVVFPGDTLHSRKPAPWSYKVFQWLIVELRKYTQVRIFQGNHDSDPQGGVGPLSTGFLTDDEHVTSPYLESFGATLKVSGQFELLLFPWMSRAAFASLRTDLTANVQHAMMADLFRGIVSQHTFARNPELPCIASTHFTMGGSIWNSGTQPVLGEATEFMLPRSVFPDNMVDLVINGHIHKPQELPHTEGLADVIYPGSPIRRDFGEEDQSCEMLEVFPVDGSFEFERIALPATEFLTLDVVYLKALGAEPFNGLLTGKVVRFKGTMPSGPETAALISAWKVAAMDDGALKVVEAISHTSHEHREISTITTATTPEDALKEFALAVGGDYLTGQTVAAGLFLKPELLSLHRELLEEVRA